MKPQKEKRRSTSQKSKRQTKLSTLLINKSPKKAVDDTKLILSKKNQDGFTLSELSTDYNVKESKTYRGHQPNNTTPNGNGFKTDISKLLNQTNNTTITTTINNNNNQSKNDKDGNLTVNTNNNNNNIIVDLDNHLDTNNSNSAQKKKLNNALQIKAVTLTTQNSNLRKVNPPAKNALPLITGGDKDKKNIIKKDDNADAKKKKIMTKSFSGMKTQPLLSQDTLKQGNSQNSTDTDENYQFGAQSKEAERQSQSANRLRESRARIAGDRSSKSRVHSESPNDTTTFQQKNTHESSSLPATIQSTSTPSNNNNSNGSILLTANATNPKQSSNSFSNTNISKSNSSVSPHKFGPLQQIKEFPSKKQSNQVQRQLNSITQKIKTHASNGNIQIPNNLTNLSQSVILSSTTPKSNLNSINNINPSTVSNTSFIARAHKIELQPQQKQVSQVHEEKKKSLVSAPSSVHFKYYVGPGNNGELVKRVMSKREWWEECEQYNSLFNFKWEQSNRGYKYERLVQNPSIKQIVNHFEYHKEISTKNFLIKNLSTYCEQNKLMLFDMTPTTFVLDMDDEVNFESDMQRFAKFFIKNHPKPEQYTKADNKNSLIVYNFDFKRKKTGFVNMSNDKKPSIYLKPKMHRTFNKGFNVWLLKPTGYNRGRGIEVFNTLEALNGYINEYFEGFVEVGPSQKKTKKNEAESGDSEGSDDEEKKKTKGPIIKSHTFVLQKYIESPLLINERKFDIRVWTLVTQDMNLYFFKEGYLRLSSEIFTLNEDNIDNKFVHLTNNAVQKYSENYGQLANGNQLSFADFEKYMIDNNMTGDFRGKMLPRIKELISISMNSVKKSVNLHDRKYCMEIFGYDFFIDSDFTVWLIEVNTNPCIEESSPILEQYLPRMLDDAFKMTLDVLFPRPYKKPQPGQPIQNIIQEECKTMQNNNDSQQKGQIILNQIAEIPSSRNPKDHPFSVDGYRDDENMWEFLCCLQTVKSPAKKTTNTITLKK